MPIHPLLNWITWLAWLSVWATFPAYGAGQTTYDTRKIQGWTLHIQKTLLESEPTITLRAVDLLEQQLNAIVRVVPAPAVAELRKVPLYFSPQYPGISPRAEYHPDSGWLRAHQRDPAMAKGIEFTNLRIFEQETDRMPNFALHELAHAYHDRFLPGGFSHADIKKAYEKAKTSGTYDMVQRYHGKGRSLTVEKAYAMTNPQEYFAEGTEALFIRNDFFPFQKQDLERHDPEFHLLLGRLWQCSPSSP